MNARCFRWLGLVLLPLLAACSGSQEVPLPALVAVAGGQEVRFYQASTLTPSSTDPINLADVWMISPAENVLDMVYMRGRLFVLTPTRLLRYDTAGLNIAPYDPLNPKPTPAPDVLAFPPGFSCTQGYLKAGEVRLLVDCETRRWRPTYTDSGLDNDASPGPANELLHPALSSLPADTRFTLGPNDGLIYFSAGSKWLRFLANPTDLASSPVEKTFNTNVISPVASDVLFKNSKAFFAIEGVGESDFFSWTPPSGAPTEPVDLSPVKAGRLAAGEEKVVAFGSQGFARIDGASPAKSTSQLSYRAGMISIDDFLYLTSGTNLYCFDLLNQNSIGSSRLNAINLNGVALAFIPVQVP
ncbi:MAG: hypothetical protein M1369_01025 [Deinococcus sp.]|nr:hypothetical protein [Deinococcus sp.]MCL5964358.1 hypothetical protein [Deinococcus sp.]